MSQYDISQNLARQAVAVVFATQAEQEKAGGRNVEAEVSAGFARQFDNPNLPIAMVIAKALLWTPITSFGYVIFRPKRPPLVEITVRAGNSSN